MKYWNAYIDWIDEDIGDGWPYMSGVSSLAPFFPLFLWLIYGFIVHSNEKPSVIEAVLFVTPAIILFLIWMWRGYLAYMRKVRAVRASRKTQNDEN